MSSKYALEVKNVSKSFRLPTEQASGIKQAVINRARGIKGYKEQHVLKDISFKVEKGDFFGIVGRNGSGKSTLLKLISQIYTPDSGSIKVNGTLVPFIELGVGFNPELTGRENVYMNGALLGFSREEVSKMYPEIVEFAELEEFMDQKLKNYSSGMQVRLAFSIAIKAQGDILVLDEVLAVGDEAFQRKCEDFFGQIKKDKTKTVILVTHSMENVKKYCNKAMLIQNGEVKLVGNPNKVADEYSGLNLLNNYDKTVAKNKPQIVAEIIGNNVLSSDDSVIIRVRYKAKNKKPVYAKVFVKFNDVVIMATHSGLIDKKYITKDTNDHELIWELPLKDFNKGNYKVEVLLQDVENTVNIANYGYDGELTFMISSPDRKYGGVMTNKGNIEWVK